MNNWLKDNAISIAIALTTLVSTYAVYGYRLSNDEARLDRQGVAITALQAGDTNTQVALAQIQTSIEYIKAQLAIVVANQNK